MYVEYKCIFHLFILKTVIKMKWKKCQCSKTTFTCHTWSCLSVSVEVEEQGKALSSCVSCGTVFLLACHQICSMWLFRDRLSQLHGKVKYSTKSTKSQIPQKVFWKQTNHFMTAYNALKKKWCERQMWLSLKSTARAISFPSFVCHWVRRCWVESALWTYTWVHDCTKKSFRKALSWGADSWHVHWHVQMSEIN